MKCAIMQPTFLPWAGYFNLIASVDVFIFLDDVQFERRSWQSRNKILFNNREHYISVPTVKAQINTVLKNINISEHDNWRNRHISTLHHAYISTPFGKEMLEFIKPIIGDFKLAKLADLNISLIITICKILGLKTKLIKASDVDCSGKRSEHIALICQELSIENYLSPMGSKEYLEKDMFSKKYGLNLSFQSFVPKEYKQHPTQNYISHLSIIDVYSHLGTQKTLEYIIG